MSESVINTLCEKQLWDIFKRDHSGEVDGRPDIHAQHPGRRPVDCITVVRDVIAGAYEQAGKRDVAEMIKAALYQETLLELGMARRNPDGAPRRNIQRRSDPG